MEKKTMGSFMAALRKANGLTQQQVADKLNVSNKTVSKWECNEGYPEISMLPVIAELYSVSVDELLRGERISKVIDEEKADVNTDDVDNSPKTGDSSEILFWMINAIAAIGVIGITGIIIYRRKNDNK